MYAVVNHFGSVGGGHYTAFCRHPASGRWNYFDDCSVTEGRRPRDGAGDEASAYVLFYQRKGA